MEEGREGDFVVFCFFFSVSLPRKTSPPAVLFFVWPAPPPPLLVLPLPFFCRSLRTNFQELFFLPCIFGNRSTSNPTCETKNLKSLLRGPTDGFFLRN